MQLGFGFGWTIFRPCWDALHIRGSHLRPLGRKFIFELVSKNLLMAGHDAGRRDIARRRPAANTALAPGSRFAMSVASLVGFMAAYPMDWWLVHRSLKRGMRTVRPGLRRGGRQRQPLEP